MVCNQIFLTKDTKRLGSTDWGDPNLILLKRSVVKTSLRHLPDTLFVKFLLLEFYLGASFLNSLLDVLSFFLGQTFLDGSGSTVNEILSLFQTETASFLNSLNDLELGSTNFSEDNVERSLLLSSGSSATSSGSSYSHSCSSGFDTIFFLQNSCQLIYFFHCEVY